MIGVLFVRNLHSLLDTAMGTPYIEFGATLLVPTDLRKEFVMSRPLPHRCSNGNTDSG